MLEISLHFKEKENVRCYVLYTADDRWPKG